MRKKLGEYLVQAGVITDADLRTALAEHTRTGERLGVVLARLNLATEDQIAGAIAAQLGFPFVSLAESPPDPAAVILIPRELATRRICVALRVEKNVLTVAMADPLLFSLVQDLERQTGCRIKQVVATRRDILAAIGSGYPDVVATPSGEHRQVKDGARDAAAPAGERSGTAATVDLAEAVVNSAITSGASDVHIEPMEDGLVIRHRRDGVLGVVTRLPKSAHEPLVARLKAMAGMDTTETRLPQDGRIRARSEHGVPVDFRVSTLRALHGEKVVMRAFQRRKHVPPLEELGLSPTALEALRAFLRQPRGMILVVGPSGSGTITTLSSALSALQSERTSIVTIEDPVEYDIPGVNQIQIPGDGALTCAGALGSVLKQDPDVILVGELRDAETARLALRAADSRQLVLATLRADTTPSALAQLMDLAGESHVIADAVVGVIAQRLVRRLCVSCRQPAGPANGTLRRPNVDLADDAAGAFYTAVGCDQCGHTGYRGRIGLYEVLPVTAHLRRLLAARASEAQLRGAASVDGVVTLAEDGWAKARRGITTADEVLRVVADVREARPLCAECGTPVSVDFVACPQCGKRLHKGCPHCGRALQAGWSFCPYCARSTESADRASKPLRQPRTDVEPAR